MTTQTELEIVEQEPFEGLALRFGMADLLAHARTRLAVLEALTEPYEIKQMERDRAALRGDAKDLNSRRLSAERAYNERFVAEIKAPIKSLTDEIESIAGQLDAWIKDAEAIDREKKRARLIEYWTGCAGILADAVPFDRIENQRWYNKTFAEAEAYKEMDGVIESAANAEKTLNTLGLEFVDDALAEYFATLSMEKAIARNHELVSRKRRAEMLKEQEALLAAERAAYLAKEQEAVSAPEPQACAPVVEVTPSLPEIVEWSVQFTGTQFQAEAVALYCKSLGLKGKVMRG